MKSNECKNCVFNADCHIRVKHLKNNNNVPINNCESKVIHKDVCIQPAYTSCDICKYSVVKGRLFKYGDYETDQASEIARVCKFHPKEIKVEDHHWCFRFKTKM